MKRCPKCKNEFSDDANFCPVDAGHLVPVESSSGGAPLAMPKIDTGGFELLAGRFSLGDVIGGHRTGPVYRARDKQGATAMVKIIHGRVFPSDILKQRMERELTQLEGLEHANVARVLGHGRRDGDIWLATERIDGVTLEDYVSVEGPLPQDRAIYVLVQIGSALEAAAKLGVIHRDLSPKNIFIAHGDQVKLINFGVAVPSDGDSGLPGVLAFVAPEQIEGKPIDQRSNIYSLGAIAYVLLTGRPPWTGTTEEILAGHKLGTARVLGENDGVSRDVSAALLKALEKTSSKRFMTVRQFVDGLQEGTGVCMSQSANGKKQSAVNMAKTLMGVAPIGELGLAGIAPQPAGETTRAEEHGVAKPINHASVPATSTTTPESPNSSQAVSDSIPEPYPSAPSPAVTPVAVPSMAPVAAGSNAPSGKKASGKGNKPQPRNRGSAVNGSFRETLWFKKGELDEAAGKAAATAKPEENVSAKADEMEMDERYKDDGSLTQTDQERLSLRTGATMMMETAPGGAAKVLSQVSEADLVSEMTSGRTKTIVVAIAVVLIVLGLVLGLMAT